MRKLRFLVPSGVFGVGSGARVVLPPDEALHLGVTLRARPGMVVHLFDGEGREFSAEVVSASGPNVQLVLRAEQTTSVEPPIRVTALQAVSQDRSFEEAVDQLTALGVWSIIPLLVERSKVGPRPPDAKRLMRWRKTAREASKLSWRRIVPAVEEPVGIGRAPRVASPGSIGLVLDLAAPPGLFRRVLAGPAPQQVHVAIGPEGGFSEPEVEALQGAGYVCVGLGPRVLRTQHAGAAALSLIMAAWGDSG